MQQRCAICGEDIGEGQAVIGNGMGNAVHNWCFSQFCKRQADQSAVEATAATLKPSNPFAGLPPGTVIRIELPR